jgi:hypothetical protein
MKRKTVNHWLGSNLVEGNASLRVSTVHMIVFQMLLNLLQEYFIETKVF